jgi:acyl-coenzyme A synthetase/AMP-(fatty) acid ligase
LPCEAIVSATAALDATLARAAEAHTGAPLIEVYGSTETCVVATRRTAHEQRWTPYPDVGVHPEPDGVRIAAPQLTAPVLLGDLVERQSDGRFALVGRVSDLIEIAGKRASLGDLTRHLLAVPGVEDAVILQHEDADASGVRRLAALVVAPSASDAAIMVALRASFDPAFLPRPLKRVPCLPRNALGKLPRAALLALLRG